MKSRTYKVIITSIALAVSTLVAPLGAAAQEPGGTVSLSNQSGRVSVKLERGSRVSISNRYGRITITGWDRDTVEATASSAKGAEAVQVEMTADPQARSTLALAVVGRGRNINGMYGGVYTPAVPMCVDTKTGVYLPCAARPLPAPRPPTTPSPSSTPKPATAPVAEGGSKEMKDKINKDTKEKIKEMEAAKNGVILVPVPDIVVETPGVIVQVPQTARSGQTTPGARGAGSGSGVGVGIGRAGGEDTSITLDVKVPRYAQLDAIEVRGGDLNVSGIDGPVSVVSGGSNITASHVGALEVRTRSGNVNVEDVDGLVYIVASSSEISVRRSQGDVRATTINGNIDIQCVKGRVDASTSRGEITLLNVGGDVEATTTDSEIKFTGAIAPNGRYRLKSMEGQIVMFVPESSPGFTANLMSYNSDALTEFPVRTSSPNPDSRAQRRVEARHGDGQAQITLDSFSQSVRLAKLAPGTAPACK
ncbi:MAG: DUF4097 family beta strand repeat-containing protein [Pyrinomonadaceae bacterium]